MLGRKKCRVARFAAIVSLSGLLAGCAEPETSTVMQDAAMCGGIAGNACPAGRTCDLPAGMCNAADLQGSCAVTADFCAEIYDPVCGCDGRTYSNDCFRLMAGAQKNHDGECN